MNGCKLDSKVNIANWGKFKPGVGLQDVLPYAAAAG